MEGISAMKTEIIEGLVNNPSDRRTFLKRVGATGLGMAAATMMGSGFVPDADAATVTDTDILNFALNLEYLEAEFYAKATYGATLHELGILTEAEMSGPTLGGNMVPNFGSSMEATMATALRQDEIKHVQFLRSALGAAAVKKPTIHLGALGTGFASVNAWLGLARIFEDVGVSAYLGAAPLITNKTYLAAAGAILSTEAFHSGSIRLACVMRDVDSSSVGPLDVLPTAHSLYDVNQNAMAIPRTTSQVLSIVYHGGTCSGGFFPDGLNGNIKCTS